ncbi:sensor histidine kinase [Psychrobacillus vulpis]|uniref:histidine kinase n=1 Tax=Psychrobacillus vulpis TaxID=2325572 RepID=A0A544TNF4_9BACI|nr:sensor histidine kinase [Psychrobacillus vulpis]TQR18939.1 HAMP domain-containing histidine kinase [Psychrobacillus vulpis]
MLLLFLKERKAWILFFIVMQIWLNFILALDVAFVHTSTIYINSVNIILFILFLAWRFFIETRYLRKLNVMIQLEKQLDFDTLLALFPDGCTPFEHLFAEAIEEVVLKSREELNAVKVDFSEENDRTLIWIHEMKTPITAIRLMIDSIENPILQKKMELEWLRIHLLLDQQLHNTRLPSIGIDNMMETIVLQKIIHKEIRELLAWCMEKGIGFDLVDLEVEVLTDQKWFSFIVRQLLTNAVKYSDENTEIRVFVTRDQTGHVLLHIQDEGIGISKADLPRIFDKSFTGSTGRLTTASTGMGLYLAKNAAEKLGIVVLVQSELGVGTTFSLCFPLKNQFLQISSR